MEHELKHPEAATSKDVMGAELDTDLKNLVSEVHSAVLNRSSWQESLRQHYKQRMASAPKPDPNWPWPGSANMAIPLTDKTITKKVPVYVNSVFEPSPIASMVPVAPLDPEISRRVEHFHDWLIRHRMRSSKKQLTHVVQNMLTYGLGFMKVVWDTQTERRTRAIDIQEQFGPVDRKKVTDDELQQMAGLLGLDLSSKQDRLAYESAVRQFRAGDKVVSVSLQTVTHNAPRWVSIDPIDVIVPWDSRDEVDELPWMVHRVKVTVQQLRDRAKLGLYGEDAVEEAVRRIRDQKSTSEWSRSDFAFRQTQSSYEGVEHKVSDSNYIDLWEVYHWYDVNGDGLVERCVSTVIPETDIKLRCVELPYHHGQWPITRFSMEERECRWYSPRGIPKMIEDLQKEINAQHNAKLDRMQIVNSPTFKVREASYRNFRNVRFRPGEFYPVRRTDDVEPMFNGQVLDFSFDREQMMLKQFVEEYVGIVDFGASGAQSGVERRTAKEIQFIERVSDQLASLDLSLFQDAMARVHHQTLLLWYQYGDEQVWMQVDGKEQVPFSRRDLANKFRIIPIGNLGNLSSGARASLAMQLMQVAASPAVSQYANIAEMWRDLVQGSTDYRTSQRYLRQPGDFETDAERQQVSELNYMEKLGLVHPVDIGQAHEIHIRVLEMAIQNAPDEQTAKNYMLHLLLHQLAVGNPEVSADDLAKEGYQVVSQGNRLYLIPIQQDQVEQMQIMSDEMTRSS